MMCNLHHYIDHKYTFIINLCEDINFKKKFIMIRQMRTIGEKIEWLLVFLNVALETEYETHP
jgi:hypothetical protein